MARHRAKQFASTAIVSLLILAALTRIGPVYALVNPPLVYTSDEISTSATDTMSISVDVSSNMPTTTAIITTHELVITQDGYCPDFPPTITGFTGGNVTLINGVTEFDGSTVCSIVEVWLAEGFDNSSATTIAIDMSDGGARPVNFSAINWFPVNHLPPLDETFAFHGLDVTAPNQFDGNVTISNGEYVALCAETWNATSDFYDISNVFSANHMNESDGLTGTAEADIFSGSTGGGGDQALTNETCAGTSDNGAPSDWAGVNAVWQVPQAGAGTTTTSTTTETSTVAGPTTIGSIADVLEIVMLSLVVMAAVIVLNTVTGFLTPKKGIGGA